MENSNSSNANDQSKDTRPKPTEDPGAKIETVTPDTEQKGTSGEQKNSRPANTGNTAEADQKDKSEETEE